MLKRLLAGLRRVGRDEGDSIRSTQAIAPLLEEAEGFRSRGDVRGEEWVYRRILELAPATPTALQLLGVLCARNGRFDEARTHLERAVELEPDCGAAWVDLGQVLSLAGAHTGARACFQEALDLDPASRNARLAMAQALCREGEVERAIDIYQELLEAAPDVDILRTLLGLMEGLGRHRDARRACESVLAHGPGHAQAHELLGVLLVKRWFEPEAGLKHLEIALAQRPNDVMLHVTRAIALRDLGRIEDSVAACERALGLDRGNPVAIFHRGMARLLARDFGRAWPDYEARLASQAGPQRTFPYPRWNGEDLRGQTILVHAEQGVGDEIMFASCVSDLAARAGQVVLECSAKLAPLFERSFPGVTVKAASQHADLNWLADIPRPDWIIPAGSLPLHFRRERSDFSQGKPYLRADEALTAEYRKRIAALGGRATVGISWRGGSAETRRALRTIDPAQLCRCLDLPGINFMSLQYDATTDEIEAVRATGIGLQHWQDVIDDYDHTAALVASVDLVVSVCTAIVHLGGALGRPVWVAAARTPEWRYGIAGDDMPWYGSVRIFRQSAAGDWREVLERIRRALHAEFGGSRVEAHAGV